MSRRYFKNDNHQSFESEKVRVQMLAGNLKRAGGSYLQKFQVDYQTGRLITLNGSQC